MENTITTNGDIAQQYCRAAARVYTRRNLRIAALAICLVLAAGCVQRTLTVKSEPPGALVYLNGAEVGRTPFTRDFVWYGTYDVQLRKEGYETLKTRGEVKPPWWQIVPLDLLAELLPTRPRDRQFLYYTLHPTTQTAADPQVMISRASELKGKLESSKHTPAVEPTTAPASR